MSINAQANSIDELFSSNVHYRVPHYQRRYVWNETNWDTLWKDILFQNNGEVEGEDHPTHFTGPIVTRSIGKKAYEVIDGQQRLATFQIILCVIRDLCNTQDDPQQDRLAKSAAKYIVNDEDVLIDDPDYEFTFIPTFYDQPAFSQVTSEEPPQKKANSNKHSILKAYNHFADLIQKHVGDDLDYEKMRRLLRSITDNFVLVKLELGGEDERPEQVFASINATGRKLSEFDYLRNDLFLRAGQFKKEKESGRPYSDTFYDDHWVFENDSQYWDEDTLESFFRAFLMAKRGPDCFEKNVKPFELYWEYRKALTDEQDIQYEFKELQNYAEFYKEMNDPAMKTYRLQFHEDLNLIFDNLNLTSLHPFMLFIKNEADLSDNDLTQVFTMLESYIVRGLLRNGVNEDKHVCRRINNFFSNLISNQNSNESANRENGKFKVEEFAGFLFRKGEPGEGKRWQHDGAVLNGLRCVGRQIRHGGPRVEIPAWNMLGYILYRIELWKIKRWNKENPSEIPIKVKFHLEDFLRRTKDDDQENVIQTERSLWLQQIMPPLKHNKLEDSFSIGNLVFCKDHLTNQLSFPEKKNMLSEGDNADVILNKELCEKYKKNDTWDVAQIRGRERMLRQGFNKIWPPPEHFLGQVPKPEIERETKPSGHASKPKTKPKVEPRWISILQSERNQPTTFVTYTESVELSEIRILDTQVIGINRDKNEQTLEKLNILFACSSAAWSELQPYIETLHSVRNERLEGPPWNRPEQLNIAEWFLQSALDRQVTVFPVTRYGHQLEGTIEDFDKNAIYMQIRECLVIVYRHGLYEFAMDEWHQGVVTEFDEDRHFGYIKSNRFERRIFVHIEEVSDRTIKTLRPNQRVEFELNHTTKGTRFSAIKVELMEE